MSGGARGKQTSSHEAARFIAAFDQGTTSSRCVIYDHDGRVVSCAQHALERSFLQPGWVQQDALEIWSGQLSAYTRALSQANLRPADILALGITNQRETTIVWDRKTGEPVYDAIVWQCRRSTPLMEDLVAAGNEDYVRAHTGLRLDAYFSAGKIAWILDNVPGARARAERGELLFGTVDTWLIWKLTEGAVHATDPTNASRTLLYDIYTHRYDEKLLALFDIPASMLPEVRPSIGEFGTTDSHITGAPLPLCGVAGDQQAALFGQGCRHAGEAKNTYGTGCFLLMHTGEKPVHSTHGLLTTVAASGAAKSAYALEGSVFNAGSALKWLRDELALIGSVDELEPLARSVAGCNGCVLVPAFNGLGTPYWDERARGALVGLTQGVTRAHVVRATLESLAYQTADVIEAMEADAGRALTRLAVDGGASRNDFLMEFQAALLNLPVVRPANTETTSLGAAFLAGLGSGFWEDEAELDVLKRDETVFMPQGDDATRARRKDEWHRAVNQVRAGSPTTSSGNDSKRA